MSTKSYDQRWLAAWRDAATRELRFGPLPTRGAVVNLRQRLYNLRKDMIKEKHPFADAAKTCKILNPIEAKDGWYMAMVPADFQYDELLEKAGYSVADAPDLE